MYNKNVSHPEHFTLAGGNVAESQYFRITLHGKRRFLDFTPIEGLPAGRMPYKPEIVGTEKRTGEHLATVRAHPFFQGQEILVLVDRLPRLVGLTMKDALSLSQPIEFNDLRIILEEVPLSVVREQEANSIQVEDDDPEEAAASS